VGLLAMVMSVIAAIPRPALRPRLLNAASLVTRRIASSCRPPAPGTRLIHY